MNKQRRKKLGALIDRIEKIRIAVQDATTPLKDIEGICEELTVLKDEEEAYKDSMPETLQNGEKGQAAEAAVGELESALDALEGLRDALNEFDFEGTTTSIDNARGEG
jgi:hypothetical protein